MSLGVSVTLGAIKHWVSYYLRSWIASAERENVLCPREHDAQPEDLISRHPKVELHQHKPPNYQMRSRRPLGSFVQGSLAWVADNVLSRGETEAVSRQSDMR